MSDFGRLLDLLCQDFNLTSRAHEGWGTDIQAHGTKSWRSVSPARHFFQGTDALGSLLSCTLWGTVYSPPYYLGISPGAALSKQMLILASIECPTVLRSILMVMEMGSQDD